jgi:hypothetical protein
VQGGMLARGRASGQELVLGWLGRVGNRFRSVDVLVEHKHTAADRLLLPCCCLRRVHQCMHSASQLHLAAAKCCLQSCPSACGHVPCCAGCLQCAGCGAGAWRGQH